MKWRKKGLIYNVKGNYDWNKSHAQLPIVDINYPDKWRIYYATRNSYGQSNISYIEVQAGQPSKILYVHNKPILELGKLGTFDESGIMPVAIVDFKKKKYLYYAGWSLKKDTPYHNTIGLAISLDDGKTFKKYKEDAILGETPREPYSTGTMFILIENGVWKAWYQSVIKWINYNNKMEPFYHLKYAESSDGIIWRRKEQIAIDFKESNEAGICSASVLVENSIYKMWYSYRKNGDYRNDKNNSYKIGYAESQDAINWERKDNLAGIDLSHKGWDSEMIAYPNVCSFEGKKFMFYNGNGFGVTGIGYAVSV